MTPDIPRVQGLSLFEVYEHSGALLLVTSDASGIKLEPGDVIIRRPWATSAYPAQWKAAAPTPKDGDA